MTGYFAAFTAQRQLLGVVNGLGNSGEGQFSCRIVGSSLVRSTLAGQSLRVGAINAAESLKKASESNKVNRPNSSFGACIAAVEIVGETATFTHLGNCRALLIRPGNEHQQMLQFASVDHVPQSLDRHKSGLSVTRAITPGSQQLGRDIDRSVDFQLLAGDLIILLTHGITQSISNNQILEIIRSEKSILSISGRHASDLASSTIALETLFESSLTANPGNQAILVYKHH